LNQEDINYFIRTSNEIEAVIGSSNNEKPWTDGFMAELYQAIKKLTAMLLKLFYQVERKEHYQTHPMKPVLP
jgi:hypothetical protein